MANSLEACSKLRRRTVGRRSCGAAAKAERRHFCRPVHVIQDHADKNVGAPKLEIRNPKQVRSPKEIRSLMANSFEACSKLRRRTVGRRSGGAATKAERRHFCRPVHATQDHADKNVGAPKLEIRNPKEVRSPKEVRTIMANSLEACSKLRRRMVGRRSGGAAAKAERRHFCRPVRAIQDHADKNVGAPPWGRLRRSVALPSAAGVLNKPHHTLGFQPGYFWGLRASDFGFPLSVQ